MGNSDEVDPMQIDLTKLIRCRLVVVVVVAAEVRVVEVVGPLRLYDEYTLNPKSRKEEWGVCRVCCSRGVVVRVRMLVEQAEWSG